MELVARWVKPLFAVPVSIFGLLVRILATLCVFHIPFKYLEIRGISSKWLGPYPTHR